MDLAAAYHEIVRRAPAKAKEPFFVEPKDWFSIRNELSETESAKQHGILSGSSDYLNFLLAGVEVRIRGEA